MKDSERLENCTLFFRVMLSRRSNMATIMLIERDPLTLTVVLRGYWWLVTWGYSWHVTWHFDILIDILTRVSLMIWLLQGLSKYVSHCQKLKDLLFISWLMTTGGRKFVTYVITKYLLIEGVFANWKKKLSFRLLKKKSLEGTLSFWNWVLNNKQKCHVYCFIFKPPLYYICIKIILFCPCSQYLSSRSVTHDKSRALSKILIATPH